MEGWCKVRGERYNAIHFKCKQSSSPHQSDLSSAQTYPDRGQTNNIQSTQNVCSQSGEMLRWAKPGKTQGSNNLVVLVLACWQGQDDWADSGQWDLEYEEYLNVCRVNIDLCVLVVCYKRCFTYLVDDGDIIFCCLSDIIKEMTLKTQTKQSRLENFKRHRIVRNFQQNYKQTSPPYFSDKVLARFWSTSAQPEKRYWTL